MTFTYSTANNQLMSTKKKKELTIVQIIMINKYYILQYTHSKLVHKIYNYIYPKNSLYISF